MSTFRILGEWLKFWFKLAVWLAFLITVLRVCAAAEAQIPCLGYFGPSYTACMQAESNAWIEQQAAQQHQQQLMLQQLRQMQQPARQPYVQPNLAPGVAAPQWQDPWVVCTTVGTMVVCQ